MSKGAVFPDHVVRKHQKMRMDNLQAHKAALLAPPIPVEPPMNPIPTMIANLPLPEPVEPECNPPPPRLQSSEQQANLCWATCLQKAVQSRSPS